MSMRRLSIGEPFLLIRQNWLERVMLILLNLLINHRCMGKLRAVPFRLHQKQSITTAWQDRTTEKYYSRKVQNELLFFLCYNHKILSAMVNVKSKHGLKTVDSKCCFWRTHNVPGKPPCRCANKSANYHKLPAIHDNRIEGCLPLANGEVITIDCYSCSTCFLFTCTFTTTWLD